MYVPPLMCRRSAKHRQSRLRAISMRSPFAGSDGAGRDVIFSAPYPRSRSGRERSQTIKPNCSGYAENTWESARFAYKRRKGAAR